MRFAALTPALLLCALPAAAVDLFHDDFSRFAPGLLSAPLGQLNGAIQEYHYIEHRGVRPHPWRNPIVHLDSWAAGDEDAKPYLEQHLINSEPGRVNPLFVTGDPLWRDTTVEASVRPLAVKGPGGSSAAGIVFRYHTSRHFYLLAFEDGARLTLRVKQPIEREFRKADWRALAQAAFPYDTKRYYKLKVENDGPRIRAYVDGKLLLEASDIEILNGQAGLMADMPARFTDFHVSAAEPAARAIHTAIAQRERDLQSARAALPAMKLLRRIDTPGFGAGKNARFGDLDGDGHLDMLIGQNVPKVRGDAFDHISCLTAISLAGPRAGQILWQHGRPNPKNALLTNDVPFQIHDLDGDGKAEVVLVRDFQLQVWDGATGKLKQKSWMPDAAPDNKETPYAINNGDSLAFFNFSGKGPRDILIKDRYRWFFVFDQDLKLRWTGEGQTGHYPYPYDFDNDGKQEFMIGYSLWDAAGKPRWSLDKQMRDHSDAISIADLSDANPTTGAKAGPRIYITGSDEGFVVLEPDGREFAHVRLGHAQTQSIGKYRPDLPGLQIMIANFWRSPGIVTLFDRDARILAQEELTPGSTHLEPVNWTGDGREFALLSANIREGGLIDGQLRRVVTFPDDGHPDLASQVLDLEGDARDEILVWDQHSIWIYTQDTPFTGTRIYAPRRNPHHNGSNYRATVSMPGWK
ncbi:MAG: hypothetical protein J0L64_22200 [Acidobacteria bacterium]|nr:hypothetical protein [Acidobacteriota bacterium]